MQSHDEVKEKVIDMLEYLPLLLILLACPLMMIFMMAGMHGGHGSSRQDNTGASGPLQATDHGTQDRVAELERQVQTLRDQLAEQARQP